MELCNPLIETLMFYFQYLTMKTDYITRYSYFTNNVIDFFSYVYAHNHGNDTVIIDL